MKNLILPIFIILITSCSNSGTNESNDLLGTWVGTCYEFSDASDGSFISYASSIEIFTVDTYTSTSRYYSDAMCTTEIYSPEITSANYSIGSQINTTDGLPATLITLTINNPIQASVSYIFRVEGNNLNFGLVNSNEIPTINYSITFIRQQ